MPTDLAEESELLRRQQSVADLVISTRECVLVLAYANGYRGDDEPASIARFRPQIMDGWAEAWSRDARFVDDIDGMEFAIAQFNYDSQILGPLMLDVAYGRTAPLMIVAMNSGRVYSPYDGGADLFFEDATARERSFNELRDWLSPRPDGL